VPDEALAVGSGVSLQVAGDEGVDQQFGLIQPRRPRRGQAGAPPAVAPVEVLRRRAGDVARAAVVDQVDASASAVPATELLQSRDRVLRVVLLQDHGPHPPGVDDQEVDGAVSGVVELPLLDRAADGPPDRFPLEDQAGGARADRLDDAVGDGLVGQVLTRPVRDMQAPGDRLQAGQLDDPGAPEGREIRAGRPGRCGSSRSPGSPMSSQRRQVRRTVPTSHSSREAMATVRSPAAIARTVRARRTWYQGRVSLRAASWRMERS
jgi:hypothetical protein